MGTTRAGASAPRFQERPLVITLVDLAGFTRAVAGLEAVEIAAVIDEFYGRCQDTIAAHGGHVIKFAGDSCIAIFEPDAAVAAVGYVTAMRAEVAAIAEANALELDMGANVHLATIVHARFASDSIEDVVGSGVIHTVRMGSGAGIRISEPVYRKLPSSQRSPWRKHQPPATYTLAS